MRTAIGLIALFIFLFYSTSSFAARSLAISANKDSLFGDEEVTVTASASGFTNEETIYVKGAFYQEGSTNYFGYTKNGESWIKNGDSTLSQKSIKIGEWDGSVVVKSDFSDSGYSGEGGYKFKIGFYYTTSGGNLSSVNWSDNNLDINLNEPDPTPTPAPTLTPTSTPVPASTPTKTPTLTPTKTVIPTPSHTPTPTLKPSVSPTPKKVLPTSILGESTQSGSIVSPTNKPSNKVISTNNNLQKVLMGVGIVFITICAILTFQAYKKGRLTHNEGE